MRGIWLQLLLVLFRQEGAPPHQDDVATWIAALDDTADGRPFTVPARDGRSAAVEALARLGADAVPALIAALSDRSRPRVVGAALALARIGPAAALAESPLARRVDDPDAEVALAAALALPAIDPASEAAARAFAQLLAQLTSHAFVPASRGDDQAFDTIVRTLARAGAPARPYLLLLRDHPDERVRRFAAELLAPSPILPPAPSPPILLPAPPPPVTVEPDAATRALLAREAQSIVDRAANREAWSAASDDSAARRARFVAILSTFTPARARELLAPLLAESDGARLVAAAALTLDVLPDDAEAADVLVSLFEDPDVAGRARNEFAMRGGRRNKAAALERAFARDPTHGGIPAAQLLLDLDRHSRGGVAALAAFALAKKDPMNRPAAALAFARLLKRDAPKETVAFLGEWLARDDLELYPRLEVLRLWSSLPPAERAWSPELLAIVRRYLKRCCASDEIETCVLAAEIVALTDPSDPAAIRTLLKILRHSEDANGREQAAHAFASLDLDARDLLAKMTFDGSIPELDRQWAAFALGGLSGDVAGAIAATLASHEPETRRWVLDGIVHWNDGEARRRTHEVSVGRPPLDEATLARERAAVRAIVLPLLNDGQRSVRAAAAVALVILDPEGGSWIEAAMVLARLVASATEEDRNLCATHLADFGARVAADAKSPDRVADPALHDEIAKLLRLQLERTIGERTLPAPARLAAVHALATVSDDGDELVGRLVDSDEETIAIDAVWALRFVDRDSKTARERLVRALATTRPWVRANAACSLLEMRRERAQALATLEEIAAGSDADVAAFAKRSLEQYAPKKKEGGK